MTTTRNTITYCPACLCGDLDEWEPDYIARFGRCALCVQEGRPIRVFGDNQAYARLFLSALNAGIYTEHPGISDHEYRDHLESFLL